jgi:anti-sigma-K factor RskA
MSRLTVHEKYAELCVLSTTGSLTDEEWGLLRSHIATCEECKELFTDSQIRSPERISKLASAIDPIRESDAEARSWQLEGAKQRLLFEIVARQGEKPTLMTRPSRFLLPIVTKSSTSYWYMAKARLATAAVLLLSVGVAYQFGYRRGHGQVPIATDFTNRESTLRAQLGKLQAERTALNEQLTVNSKSMNDMNAQFSQQGKELTQIRNLKDALDEKARQLALENQQQSQDLDSVTAERDRLLQKSEASERSIKTIQEDLNGLRDERQKFLLRTASLETEIDQLSAQLREKDATVGQQEQYLTADRDIREMMGARQLYIADVFDVDQEGKTRKPFGRVFYTRAKSLIFYAFDLDRTRGYRQAKEFQAWGRQGEDGAEPVNLGIFYIDSETNRRWVLKSNDPAVLARIDAVFVTVEPKGGSKKPSGKPLLYAYLHTVSPNHP